LVCVSCAGRYEVVPSPEQTPPVVESVSQKADKSCAYAFFLKGKEAEFEGRFDEALEHFEKAINCDKDADYIRGHLAILLARSGQPQKAMVLMEELVNRHPDDIKMRSILANLYASTGKSEEAAAQLQYLLQENPGDTQVMLMLGSLYAREGEFDKALVVFEKVVKTDPQSYIGYYYLARLYKELQDFDKAAASYKKALSLNWSAILAFELAELHESREQFPEAIALYRKILAEDETNEQALRKIASLYLRTGKVDAAVTELKKLRLYVEEPQKIDLIIARILLQGKKYKEATIFLSDVLKEDPQFDTARYLLAIAYHESGNSTASKKLLQEMPPESQRYEDAVLYLVGIYRDEGDYDALEELLRDNIANEKSRKISYYVALAALYEEKGNLDEAKNIFAEALRVFPSDTKLLFEYGLFLDSHGDQDKALVVMEKILTINGEDPFALNYVGYTWADKNINLDKALDYIERAIAQRPEDGYIRDSLGWVYFRKGDLNRAQAELEQAVSLKDDDPTIHEHLGDVYSRLKKKKQARESYQKALELYSKDDKKEEVRRKLDELAK